MKETLTEFEELQEAFKKVNMNEEVMPIVNGKVLFENAETYKKMQLILDTPELIKSHNYIMNLDPEQLSEDDCEKVQKLFDLGVNRGFITPDCTSDDAEECDGNSGMAVPEQPAPEKPAFEYKSAYKPSIPCWTILYSACNRDGNIKTGECFSNSTSPMAAKADCYAKLERCGYSNISILAIEAGDPDNCNRGDSACICSDGNCDSKPAVEQPIEEAEEMQEDDMLKTRPHNGNAMHNGHIPESEKPDMIPEDEFINAPANEADNSFENPNKAHVSRVERKDHYAGDDADPVVDVEGPTDDEEATDDGEYPQLYAEFLTAADDYKQALEYHDEESSIVTNAFKAAKGAYEDCYRVADNDEKDELMSTASQQYGFDISDESTISNVGAETLDESGNPYLAGMKTSSIGGVSSIGTSKPKKMTEKEDEEESADSDDAEDTGSEETSDEEIPTEDTSSSDEDSDTDDAEDETPEQSDSEDEETADDTEDSDEEVETADDSDSEETTDDNSEEDSNEETEDSDDSEEDDSEEDEADDIEDDSDEDSEEETKSDDSEELTDEEKAEYKSDYKKTFKDVMLKCEFEDKCFDDLTIAEKVTFFTKLNKAWKKAQPADFMSDKEIDQLNKVVVKK